MKPIEQLVMSGCSAETEYLCWLALYEELSAEYQKKVEEFFQSLQQDVQIAAQTRDFYTLQGYLEFHGDRQQKKLLLLDTLHISDSQNYTLTVQHVHCPYAFFAEESEEPEAIESNEEFIDSMFDLSVLEMEYLKQALEEKFAAIKDEKSEEWEQFIQNISTVQEARFYDDLHHMELLEYLDRQLHLVSQEREYFASLPVS